MTTVSDARPYFLLGPKLALPFFLVFGAMPAAAVGLQSWSPVVLAGSTAASLNVYPGCAVPTSAAGAHTFLVDPVNGSDSGDGSPANPWRSLQVTVSSKLATAYYTWPYGGGPVILNGPKPVGPVLATRPVQAGDTILLASGNHGAVVVTGVNTDFITIAAAPGAHPVLSSLQVAGASKFIFEGLKVQGLASGSGTSWGSLVTISYETWSGPVDNIVFDQGDVSSANDMGGWSLANWQTVAMSGVRMDGGVNGAFGACLSVTRSSIYNIKTGIGYDATGVLVYGNTIDNFGDDAIDYDGDQEIISRNLITNSNTIGDGNHNDAMQGQIGHGTQSQNILIDGNTILRQTTPALAYPGFLQGIDAFDNDWYDVTVTNNVVVTNAWQGIAFASIHGGLVANNTVLSDGVGTDLPWVGIFNISHEGSPSDHVIVQNNLASSVTIESAADMTSIGAYNNLVAYNVNEYDSLGQYHYYLWQTNAGTFLPGGNLIDSNSLRGAFTNFDPLNYAFDVSLVATSPAVQFGAATSVPPTDILGVPRHGNLDAGAYAFVQSNP